MPLLPTSGADIVRQTRSSAQSKVAQGLSRSGPKPNNVSGSIQVRSAIPKGFSFPSIARIFNWIVSTFAGQSTSGFIDAIGILAKFNTPYGVALDSAGNVYIADSANNRIRKIVISTGAVTTFAGSGTGTSTDNNDPLLATFNYPTGLAFDSSGNLYVSELLGHKIRKIAINGNVTTLAGSGAQGFADGIGILATFNYPQSLAVDSAGNNLYIADTYYSLIRKIVISTGAVTTFAGSGVPGFADGIGTAAIFNTPRNIAVDSSGNNLYIVDSANNRIRKIVISTAEVTTFAGSGVGTSTDNDNPLLATFQNPAGLAFDSSGNLYVSDTVNYKIRKIAINGNVTTLAGTGAGGFQDGIGTAAKFNNPRGIAVDSSGNLYVADSDNHRIRKLTPT